MLTCTAALLACSSVLLAGWDEAEKRANDGTSRRAIQRELEPFNDWVGGWRGVGQPRRGSNKGAWVEQADWEWKIDRHSAELRVAIEDGKLFRDGSLAYDPETKAFRLVLTSPSGQARTYLGTRDNDKLVLISAPSEKYADTQRLTFQMRHDDRLLLLIESKTGSSTNFGRVAEIGYTRKGGNFAAAADAGPKCIVTGGRGTTPVEYQGKTYYVCCTGCKQAFQDDPAAIIAEAAERTQSEKAKKDAARKK